MTMGQCGNTGIRNGHLGVARELIEAGAAKEPQDVGLWTPLVWAAYKVCDHSKAEQKD